MWLPMLLALVSSVSSPPAASALAPRCELVRTDVRAVDAVYGAAAAADADAVYFAGGDSPTKLIGDVWRYVPGARGFTELDKVGITPRRYAGAAFLDGRLVVVGGSDRREPLAIVEAVDVKTQTLERWPDLPTPRAFVGVAVHEGAVWVAGGEQSGGASRVVEIFDPKPKAWRVGPPLSVARATRLVVMAGALWALPGYNGKTAVPVLERLEGGAWVRKDTKNDSTALSAFAASAVEGGALLFGDYRTQDGIWFLAEDGTLSRTSTKLVERRHAAAASARGQVVVFGGNRTSANASSVGVLEAFEARCVAVAEGEDCDALQERGVQQLRTGDATSAYASFSTAAARCGVGRFDWLNAAMSQLKLGDLVAATRSLKAELERPAAHPEAFKLAFKLASATDPSPSDPAIDALLRPLGRTKDTAISSAAVKGQRAWVERFACEPRIKPADVKQALTRDQLDQWSFTCDTVRGELWFDFNTRPVAAFSPTQPMSSP
jgi:hypothetical protein